MHGLQLGACCTLPDLILALAALCSASTLVCERVREVHGPSHRWLPWQLDGELSGWPVVGLKERKVENLHTWQPTGLGESTGIRSSFGDERHFVFDCPHFAHICRQFRSLC